MPKNSQNFYFDIIRTKKCVGGSENPNEIPVLTRESSSGVKEHFAVATCKIPDLDNGRGPGKLPSAERDFSGCKNKYPPQNGSPTLPLYTRLSRSEEDR